MALTIMFVLEMMVLVIYLNQSAAIQYHCRDPDPLPTLHKTEEDITMETRWIVPGTLPNNAFNQFMNITYDPINKLGSCHNYMNRNFDMAAEPISIGSTCPWFHVNNIDSNRIPRVITEAECACQCCGRSSCAHDRCSISHRPKLCRKIYRYTTVLRRTSCIGGVYIYSRVIEPVSVGCTCVRCPLPIYRRMNQ